MTHASSLGNKILINEEGEWRCLWRVLAFYILFFLIASFFITLIAMLRAIFSPPGEAPPQSAGHSLAGFAVERSLFLIATLAASGLCARMIERRTLSSTGYKLHDGWSRDFLFGWAVGALAIALAVAMAAGTMAFTARQITVAESARNFSILFVVFLIAAAFEEVLLRGFAFQTLIRDAGPVAAVLITSVAFAALHLANKGATTISTINTAIAGVWLGVAYLKTRSLWLATALHHSWNLVMVVVFGLPVSGIADYKHMAMLDGKGGDPVWISGGDYGPEGGVAATLAIALCAVFIARSRWFKASDEMQAAIVPGSAETRTSIFPKDSSRASR